MGVRRSLIPLFAVLLAWPAGSFAAEKEMIFSGYLFRGNDGRLHIGQAVIAMGVMAGWDHSLSKELSTRFAGLASEVDTQHFFWNYGGLTKVEGGEKPFAGAPRFLVRIHGKVQASDGGSFSSLYEMDEGRLLEVEFLSVEWLSRWAAISRLDDHAAMGFASEKSYSPDEIKKLAPRILELLLAMRSASEVTSEQKERARKCDAGAQVSNVFQRAKEEWVHRWLDKMERKHSLGLELQAKLGPLPPRRQDLVDWFLTSETRGAFFEKIRSECHGQVPPAEIYYYVVEGRSTSYTTVSLGEIQRRWSEADFKRHQENSRRVLKR